MRAVEVKGSWPKITSSVERLITATHSLPDIGAAEPHEHKYLVRAGWTHEINPTRGCTKSMAEMEHDFFGVVSQLDGADLNVVLPFAPTAETMACWVMARLPAFWQFVEIECYGSYKVRITAGSMRQEWTKQYL